MLNIIKIKINKKNKIIHIKGAIWGIKKYHKILIILV